jgi:hypothetical protein
MLSLNYTRMVDANDENKCMLFTAANVYYLRKKRKVFLHMGGLCTVLLHSGGF